MTKSRIQWLALLLVTLFALYMNLTAVSETAIDIPIRGDAREYVSYAFNLKVHGVFSRAEPAESVPTPDAIRSPGYPLFMASVLDLGAQDRGVKSVTYPQAFLGVMTTLLSMLLFSRMMPFPLSILGGLLVAISPHLVNANVYLLSESLFALTLVAHVYALVLAKEKESLPLYGLSGALLAASWLVRPTTMLLAPAYILIFGFAIFKRQLGWKEITCLVLPFVLAFSGWGIRNEVATGSISDSTLTKHFIHHGSYINLMYQDKPETYGYPYLHDPAEINTVADAIDLTIEHFKSEPWRFVYWVLIGKPVQFLNWNLSESVGDGFVFAPLVTPYSDNTLFIQSQNLSRILHTPLMLLAVIGSFYFFIAKARFALQVSSIVVLYFMGMHMIGAPFPRYSIPIRPFCYGIALSMLFEIYSILRRKSRQTPILFLQNCSTPSRSGSDSATPPNERY